MKIKHLLLALPFCLAVFAWPVAAAPVITLAGQLDYVEDQGFRLATTNLILLDPGSAQITGATVQITGNFSGDQDILRYGGNVPEIFSTFDTNTGRLTLTGAATVADYQAALQNISYRNTSEWPSTATRTVTWAVADDQLLNGTNTSIITVYSVNDAPVITCTNDIVTNKESIINRPFYLGLHFVDVDAGDAPNVNFEITITHNSLNDKSGALQGFPTAAPSADVQPTSVKFTASIAQANLYCSTLYFTAKKLASPSTTIPAFTITVTVNDNGYTGAAPPPSTALGNPLTAVKQISVYNVNLPNYTTTNGVDITTPVDALQATSTNSPAGQVAAEATDNTADTKYLNFDKFNSGFTISPAYSDPARALTLVSAEDSPERDPASYRVDGSTDGTNFTLIASNTVPPFIARHALQTFNFSNEMAYPFYRVTFPTVADAATANSMQISEVELLSAAEITSTNAVASLTPPAGATVVRDAAELFDHQMDTTNKLEVAGITNGPTLVDIAPAGGATVLRGFELIGATDDLTFPGRSPTSIFFEGSNDGTNFALVGTSILLSAPAANLQLREYSYPANNIPYVHYRAVFGQPASGDRLQVGELRLFGEPFTTALNITCSSSQVTLAWSGTYALNLESRTSLSSGAWLVVTNLPPQNINPNTVTLPLAAVSTYFRLNKP